MGAWGYRSFDNDTACDWTYRLATCDDLSAIKQTLGRVLGVGDEYLDSDAASEGIAACEAIARLRGNFGEQNAYTETVDQWVRAHQELKVEVLLVPARQVLDRVTDANSELVELWKESDSLDEWLASLDELRSRLT